MSGVARHSQSEGNSVQYEKQLGNPPEGYQGRRAWALASVGCRPPGATYGTSHKEPRIGHRRRPAAYRLICPQFSNVLRMNNASDISSCQVEILREGNTRGNSRVSAPRFGNGGARPMSG